MRFINSSLMKRCPLKDMFFVGAFTAIGIFSLEVNKKFYLLKVLSGYGTGRIQDMYHGADILVIVLEQ